MSDALASLSSDELYDRLAAASEEERVALYFALLDLPTGPTDPMEQLEMWVKFTAEAMRGNYPDFGPDRGSPDAAYQVARAAGHWALIVLGGQASVGI